MFNSNTSLADIAAVTGRNNGGFGDSNGLWVLIVLFALFGGFGNNGIGNSNGVNAVNADMQRGFDANAVNNKLNSIGDGICSLGYDQLQQMNGVNQNVTQVGYNLATQLAQCCCDTRQGIARVQFDMSNYACQIGNQIQQMGQTIIQNDNNNYRALHDEMFQMRMEDKNETIARQQNEINALRLAASQSEQNAYLIHNLKQPTAIPAYNVPNPYGWGNGCCGGNFNNNGCC